MQPVASCNPLLLLDAQMLQMEAKVLQALEYRVASTTCYGFVQRYALAGCASEKQKSLVMVRPFPHFAEGVFAW